MPEPLRPLPTKIFGRRNRIIVPSIASLTLAPTVAEATGASALDVSRMLFANGTDEPDMTTDAAELDRMWGDTESYEFIGETKYTGGMLVYIMAVQSAAGSDGRKLYEKIPAGFTGFMIDRLGTPRATNVIAAQRVNVMPIEIGPSFILPQGDGASAQSAAKARFAITGPIAQDVAVLA